MLAAVGAAWFAPRPVIAAISLIAAAAAAFPWQDDPWLLLGEPAMLVALALLALGKERMPRYWLWLLSGDLAAQVLTNFGGYNHYPVSVLLYFPWQKAFLWGILGAVVLWAVVDARPAIAVGIFVALADQAIPFVTSWQQYSTPGAAFGPVFNGPLFWGAMLALAAALRLRRQAVL